MFPPHVEMNVPNWRWSELQSHRRASSALDLTILIGCLF